MKKIKFLTIVLTIALMTFGCTSKEEDKTSNDKKGSAITSDYINLTMVKPKTINPIMNTDKSVGYITNLIYDGLFTIDENYNVVPQLVEEYGISQSGTNINIKLKDATWHDGTSVTSRDVAFTVDLIKQNSQSPYKVFTDNIASVSIVNDKEFNIKFINKYAFSVDTLIFPIVSKNQLSSLDNTQILDYKKNLIGSGPYKVEKYQERENIVLVVNENYYEELPKTMKNIKVNMVPDEESQVAMVMALQSDIGNITLKDLSKFQEKEFNITNYEGRDYEYIQFNFDNVFLRDINLRKAIAHAINTEKILDEGYMGDATLVNFPLNSNSKYYDKSLKSLNYDKEKAKEYLGEVKLTGENKSELNSEKELNDMKNEQANTEQDKTSNIEENKNKENMEQEVKKMISELNLKIIVNKENSERIKTAYVISSNLKDIGIKSTIEELTSDEIDKALSKKEYDLALLGWELPSVPDVTSIIENSGYMDDKLQEYMVSLVNATSQNQVQDIYKSIQKHVRDNVAFINLVIRDNYIVTNRRLNGSILPNDFDVYKGISNINIKK